MVIVILFYIFIGHITNLSESSS